MNQIRSYIRRSDMPYFCRCSYTVCFVLASKGAPFIDTFTKIVNIVKQVGNQEIPLHRLIIRKRVAYNYFNPNFYMKLFVDRLNNSGRNIAPGTVVEYLVIKNDQDFLGNRMILPEELTRDDYKKRIDWKYYLHQTIGMPIQHLFQYYYPDEIDFLSRKYQITRRNGAVLTIADGMRYLIVLQKEDPNMFEHIVERVSETMKREYHYCNLEFR